MRIDNVKLYILGDSIELSTMLLPNRQAILCKNLEEYLEISARDSIYTVNLIVNSQLTVPNSLFLQINNIELTKDMIVVIPVREALSAPVNNSFGEYKLAPWEKSRDYNPTDLITPSALLAYSPILRNILSEGWIKAPELASDYDIIPYTKEGVYRVDPSIYEPANEKVELFKLLETLSNDISYIKENKPEYTQIGIIASKIVEQNIEKHTDLQNSVPETIPNSTPDFSNYFRTNSKEIRAKQRSLEEISNLSGLAMPDEIAYNIQRRRPRGFTQG